MRNFSIDDAEDMGSAVTLFKNGDKLTANENHSIDRKIPAQFSQE